MTPLDDLLGSSAPLAAVREQVARLLRRRREGGQRLPPVLILGETGTGKGLLAGAIHRAGPRAEGPFVDVNCAAIPETLLEAELFGYERGAFTDARQGKPGLFQTAHRGMLFLDEVGLLPEGLQAKLLKVLEERVVRRLGSTRSEPADVWVIAATSEDLAEAVQARRFREDLYHRLAVVTLVLPPLRERDDDVVHLAVHFLGRACADYGLPPRTLSPDAQAALRAYPWPGNVRELANTMERVGLLAEGTEVTAAMLELPTPRAQRASRASPAEEKRATLEAAAEAERARFLDALRATGWNLSRAAARLRIPRNTFRYRINKLGLGAAATPSRSAGAEDTPGAAVDEVGPPPVRTEGPGPSGLRWEPRRVTFLRARVMSPDVEPGSSEISRVMAVLVDKARSFGGRVDELSPLGALTVFGLELVEDAPRRAAHAAMAIDKAVGREGGGDRARPAVTVAIHTAELLVGRVAGEPRIDADAKRVAMGICDALIDRAGVGTVVVSASAAPFLQRRFGLAALAAPEGVAEPVYRLSGAREAEASVTRFVGREGELHLLVERLERARAGQGQLVLIVGDPGIGKSRLLRELRHRVADGATWLEGHALSFGGTMAFHPVIDLLRRAFGIDDGDPEATVVGKIEDYILPLGDDLRPTLPFLRYLLALDPGDASVADMEPALRRTRIFEAVSRLFLAAAEARPLVVIYEDVHWMDPATEEYLAVMANTVAASRVLLILTSRPGYAPPFTERSFHTRLTLPSLSTAESLELARALLASPELPEALQRLVTGKAEGNPLFVEEVIRSLQETGALQRVDDRLVVGRVEDIGVPDTIQDLLLARIARLESAPRHVLQIASVVGKDVPFALLRAIADLPEDALRAELGRLQAAEFLHVVSFFPEPEYAFNHTLTQEVAYGALEPDRRRRLHARIVPAIQQLAAGRLDEQVERLAYHAYRGDLWDQTLTYARRGGLQALARSANREAVASFEQALHAARMLEGIQDRRSETVDLLFDLRTALSPLGQYERILEHLREAETLAVSLNDQRRLARVATDLIHYFWVTGEQDRAVDWGQRAQGLARALGDRTLEALADHRLGRVYHALADYRRAIDFSRRSFAVLEKAGPDALPGRASAGVPSHHWLVWSLAELGEFRDGLVVAQEGLRTAEADGRPLGLVGARLGIGYLLFVKGDFPDAIAVLEPTLALIEAWQFPAWFPPVAAALAFAYTLSGRVGEALPLAEAAVARGSAMRLLVGHAYWIATLGAASARAGRVEAAARLLEEARALARQRRERGYEAWALRLGAETAMLREPPDTERSAETFREAAALAAELGMRPLLAHCHLGLGRLYRATGDGAKADEHLATAASLYREMDMGFWLAQMPTAQS